MSTAQWWASLPIDRRAILESMRLKRAARLTKEKAECKDLEKKIKRVYYLIQHSAYSAAIHAARCGL